MRRVSESNLLTAGKFLVTSAPDGWEELHPPVSPQSIGTGLVMTNSRVPKVGVLLSGCGFLDGAEI